MVIRLIFIQSQADRSHSPHIGIYLPEALNLFKLKDWSLIMGRGGAYKTGGGGNHVKFYPYKKGDRKKF